ncbi:hypothetical protein BU25DRAFT_452232 [Macroventuria anomochaeta]|uniref:Uncharacterized protein n=1 Tax=Macroventuria anomochaeta TaxID=301207 RepID=A0ACB6RJG4_9PLEO|nr:uncharacterized protein BU25DRAFT_452232 [Macroventuria anomochaeta]KAF2622131.1 hypothetical protein BU25DRAFT_452232 [Macroventuria anomochaeta]
MDSPASDLSDYASDDFPDEVKGRRLSMEPTPGTHERPSKRLRLNNRAPSSPPAAHANPPPPLEDLGDLSEDTDGSVPASPNHHPGMSQDDDFGQDQVTACKWEGCEAGDLENMDNLVEHLHDDHIGTRQKKYSCEWSDCTRKGIPHASGYALRAHMRSHTREKPFYCTLPECDRSFTRSDALAKHMRTVHETEALRPSDPVPKHHSSNPSNKFQRIRLVLSNEAKRPSDSKGSTPASPSSLHPPAASSLHLAHAPDADHSHNNITYIQDLASPGAPTMVQFPPDISFTPAELSLPANALFHSLRRTLQLATEEGEALRQEADALEKQRKAEWDAKEVLFENYMEFQIAKTRRDRLEQGLGDGLEGLDAAECDVGPSRRLEVEARDGRLPWWREEGWAKRLAEARNGGQEPVGRPGRDVVRAEEPVV